MYSETIDPIAIVLLTPAMLQSPKNTGNEEADSISYWLRIIMQNVKHSCLVGLVALSATATLEVLGSIARSRKVLLGSSMKISVAVRS